MLYEWFSLFSVLIWGDPIVADDAQPDELYIELWKLCSSPMVDVPRKDEIFFYFPQGHMEQLQALTNQEFNPQNIPNYKLPSKILCNVVNCNLLVEPETDEVYAWMLLLPEDEIQKGDLSHLDCPSETREQTIHSFCKKLTASDTNTHGGFLVLRKHANECFPPLDTSQDSPSQELVAKDLYGFEWKFKHIMRGQPRRHLLTTGWSKFVISKKLVAGDTIVFVRGENGDLKVGVRHLARHRPMTSSVLSSQSMHMGVLTTVAQAVETKEMFTVYYRPRVSQFIVGLNKYLEAMSKNYTVGMRFKMRFEGEESVETMFFGTIVGIGDISPHWPNSKWRSLKVQWDEPTTIQRPESVSPWDIELFQDLDDSNQHNQALQPMSKRFRPIDVSSSAFWYHGGPSQSHEIAHLGSAIEGQTYESQVGSHMKQKEIVANPMNVDGSSQIQPGEACSAFDSGGSSKPFSDKTTNFMAIQPQVCSYPPAIPSWPHGYFDDRVGNENIVENSTGCKVFGVNFKNSSNACAHLEKEPGCSISFHSGSREIVPLVASETDGNHSPTNVMLKMMQKQVAFDASPNEKLSKQVFAQSMRNHIMVRMPRTAVIRVVDLTMLNSYDDLIDELEKLYDIRGELHSKNKWQVAYTDDEDELMAVGDDHWNDFCKMATTILILTNDEVEKMNANSKLYASLSNG